MKAVWSFWSKPYRAGNSMGWKDRFHHLLSWTLSVEVAQRHFSDTLLFTDDFGAKLLAEELTLSFANVSTSLSCLDNYDPNWWAVGKVLTYAQQKDPFVHIDSDVYLWKGLPQSLTNGQVIAQNPEYFDIGYSWYYPQKFEAMLHLGGFVPEAAQWYYRTGRNQKAFCCGIFGGSQMDFIRHYADTALQTLLHPRNAGIWTLLGADNILIEQYLLSACVEYHNANCAVDERISVSCLFGSSEEAFGVEASRQKMYTHLIGGAKRNTAILGQLRRRVQNEFPQHYDLCRRLAAGT